VNSDVSDYVNNSKSWQEEMRVLRMILKNAKLAEHLKWQKPCYCYDGANVAIIQPFKSCLALMFFKGTLLKDKKKLLVDNGPNSRSAKRMEFRSVPDIKSHQSDILAYITEAVNIEKQGLKVQAEIKQTPMPEELLSVFKKNSQFKKAFEALTPGRQRSYILHFSEAKQSSTRVNRIEKCLPKIFQGKGFNER
jgi:uncharacterized protein YdeI (YjbR/CyaY-like superfamily)